MNILKDFRGSDREKYIPALMEYGFTKQRINTWRFTNTNIKIYISQLVPALNGYTIPSPDHYIGNIMTVGEASGELSDNDVTSITRFLNDLYNNCRQIIEIVKKDNKPKNQNEQLPVQQVVEIQQQETNNPASIDTFELEDAIINYVPNSKSQSFIPILQEYGFTEAQINSWRSTNLFINQYYNEIYQVISGDKFNKVTGPDHFIGTIRAVGEIKDNDLKNLIIFLNDTYNIAQQINNERLKELEKKIISHENGLIIYGVNITYDGNGNTGGEVPVDETLYRFGTLVELKDGGNLKREGYKFMGWSENKEASSWINSNTVDIKRDTTLYAVWIDLDTINQQTASQVIQQKQNAERNQNIGYTVYH
jgi:hypothetical protein